MILSSCKPLPSRVAAGQLSLAVANLLSRSTVMQDLVAAGQLSLAAAMQDLQTGAVSWLAQRPGAALAAGVGQYQCDFPQ